MPESTGIDRERMFVCSDCDTGIPVRDVVLRYMRMREVAPDTKVSAVACPECRTAIPLDASQFAFIQECADRAMTALEGCDDDPRDYRSRHAALLLMLAHELGLTPERCAEGYIIVRVRELVANAHANHSESDGDTTSS